MAVEIQLPLLQGIRQIEYKNVEEKVPASVQTESGVRNHWVSKGQLMRRVKKALEKDSTPYYSR